jgi:hypothetical protein
MTCARATSSRAAEDVETRRRHVAKHMRQMAPLKDKTKGSNKKWLPSKSSPPSLVLLVFFYFVLLKSDFSFASPSSRVSIVD